MQLLLIEDKSEVSAVVLPLLQKKYDPNIAVVPSLQAGIEILERKDRTFDLIICDYHGQSVALLKCLLSITARTPCIILTDSALLSPDLLLVSREAILETLNRGALPSSLDNLLDKFRGGGLLSEAPTQEADFLRIATKSLVLTQPLQADIYIRLSSGRLCQRFKKADNFNSEDLRRHFHEKGIEAFYVPKEQMPILFDHQIQAVDALLLDSKLDANTARTASTTNLQVIHNVVGQMGFTPQVEELAKKTVSLTLKAIGNSPNLSPILERLRLHEGKYITSHSVMLAEISCALAYRIGWGGAPVFLKLSLAAFLHDLSLTDNRMASFRTLSELEQCSNLKPEDVQAFKFHPVKAAEYSRQFNGIPPDVDTILVQHHELPEGTGFPRGLFHHQINPIACIFIVAHDLLHYFLDQVSTNDRADMMKFFLHQNRLKYSGGTFLEIRESLETGVPINSPLSAGRS